MLQVRELTQLIAHKLDADAGAAMSGIAIVNEAGRWLISARHWNFQLRPQATLGIVNGQNYVVLPTDFAAILHEPMSHPSASRVRYVQMTNFDVILDRRGAANPPTIGDGYYMGALVASPLGGGGPPTQRMEVWPNVSVTDASAFTLAYFAKWDERASDEDYINLPEYAEGLLRHLVRELAAGYENDDEQSPWARMDSVKASTMYEHVVMADTSAQSSLGPTSGGAAAMVAAQRATGAGNWPFYPVHI